jgi:hypothetical protein
VDQFSSRLQAWKNVYVVYRGLGLEDRHVVTKCIHEIGKKAGKEVERRRRRIRLESSSCCWKCRCLQSMCNRFDEEGKCDTGKWCQFYGILMAVVFGMKFGFPGIWDGWNRRLGFMGIDVSSKDEVE